MTAPRRSGEDRSAFGSWMRCNDALHSIRESLCASDIDWIIHQYKTQEQSGRKTREIQNFMFLEEKTFCADVGITQRDTVSIANQILMNGARKGTPQRIRVYSHYSKSYVTVRFFGYHLVRFSHAGPEDSEWIQWDWKRNITRAELVKLLRFELSPITLRPRDERNHHGGAKQRTLSLGS